MTGPLFHCGRLNSVRFIMLISIAHDPAAWTIRITRYAALHGYHI